MRYHVLLGLFTTLTASAAMAQQEPHMQTLDAQFERMQKRQAAAPVQPYKRATVQQYRRQMAPGAGHPVQAHGANAIPALPLEIRTVGEIRYITGGIGDEEIAQLESVKKDYNFQLLMTGRGGAYIGDATVRISNSEDRLILSTDGAGPYLYATLPAGKYKLSVTTEEGVTKTATVTVHSKGTAKPVMRFEV